MGFALTICTMLQFGADGRFECDLLRSWHRCASSVSGAATSSANILGAILIAFTFSPHIWPTSAHELTSNYLGVGDFLRRESSKHPGAVTMDANSFSCSILRGKSSRFGEGMSPGGHSGLIMQLAPFRSVGEALQSASRSYYCKRYKSERL